jgi:hypothetical protein
LKKMQNIEKIRVITFGIESLNFFYILFINIVEIIKWLSSVFIKNGCPGLQIS